MLFRSVLERPERFDPGRSVHAWLLGFVVNVLRDNSSCSSVEKNDSAAALSRQLPVRPMDCLIRCPSQASVNSPAV